MQNFEQAAPSKKAPVHWEAMVPFAGFDELPADCHDVIRAGAEYWQSIHPETGLPGPQHLDLTAIPRLHPHLRLIDVVGDPPRFRIRQTGSHVAYFLGAAQPGEWFDEFFPDFGNSGTCQAFMDVVDTGRPNWRRGRCDLSGGKGFTPVERVQLPFATDGETVDMIMVCVVFGVATHKIS